MNEYRLLDAIKYNYLIKMLNLLHNSNNYSFFDNKLLSYGLLLGSLSIVGFSMYYFSANLFKQNVDKITDNLPNLNNQDIITQNVVKNLEAKNISNLDIIVPKSSLNSEVDILLHKADAYVQTGSGILNRTDIDVTRYTDQGLFIPWEGNLKSAMQELLYGMASDNHSITEMTPSEFAVQIRNNEACSRYFDKITNWVDSVPSHVASSNGSYNSEISFIRQVLENLNSAPTSPIVELNKASTIELITQTNNNILILIQRKIEYLHNVTLNIEELRKILHYYESVLHESNLKEYVVYCTNMCGSQIFPLM
jgi:hypothetical protein